MAVEPQEIKKNAVFFFINICITGAFTVFIRCRRALSHQTTRRARMLKLRADEPEQHPEWSFHHLPVLKTAVATNAIMYTHFFKLEKYLGI